MELREYLRLARRWSWLVILGSLLAAGIAYAITGQVTRIYRAHAIVLVNQTSAPSIITYQDVLGSQQLANTYARLALTDINLARALEAVSPTTLTLDELREQARADVASNTQLIDIAVRNPDPQLAADLANGIANSLPGYIREAQLAGEPQGSQPLNSVFVAQEASAPTSPISPNVATNTLLGLLAGFFIMVVGVAVVEYLTDGIDSVNDIEALGATALGAVWEVSVPRGTGKKAWYPSVERDFAMRESLGRVQANLAFALSPAQAKVVLVTSPHAGDGKTTLTTNLALTLAHAGRRVLLIDGDLRKPSVHRYISTHNAAGLSSAFLLQLSSAVGLIRTVTKDFDVLTSGPVPPNPVELLGSTKVDDILETITKPYDIVIVDSPPVLGIADASLWASHVDGILLVVRRGRTTRGQLDEAVRALRNSQKPLLGVVLNAARPGRSKDYYEQYAYAPPTAPGTPRNAAAPERRGRSRPRVLRTRHGAEPAATPTPTPTPDEALPQSGQPGT